MQANGKINQAIDLGFKQAKIITKTCAKTFYFASQFLPPKKRQAAYSVYSICRISDDSVDNKDEISAAERIKSIEAKITQVYNGTQVQDCLLLAFKQTVRRYQVPKQYFEQLIEGMYMDLHKNRYQDFGELYSYCYKVAAVVGLIMLKIFGYQSRKAEKFAVDLGIAMQLTNILRDIKEDYARGRIYLPANEMQRFGVAESDIAGANLNANFIALLKYQIQRAREYYAHSVPGIKLLSERSSRLVVRAMKDLYSGILDVIEKNHYDVFSQRRYINTINKVIIAVRILLKGERAGQAAQT